jgi:hypothetical protein
MSSSQSNTTMSIEHTFFFSLLSCVPVRRPFSFGIFFARAVVKKFKPACQTNACARFTIIIGAGK